MVVDQRVIRTVVASDLMLEPQCKAVGEYQLLDQKIKVTQPRTAILRMTSNLKMCYCVLTNSIPFVVQKQQTTSYMYTVLTIIPVI